MDSNLYPSANEILKEQENNKNLQKKRREELDNIKGKTLEVYYFMVDSKKKKFGVREIQRELDYSSPSIAAYHLNRLYEHQLIKKSEDGQYYIEGDPVALGALKEHVQVAGLIVPRILIYGIFAVISIIASFILFIAKSDSLVWLVYFTTINVVMIAMIIRDALRISNKLKVK